MDDPKVRRERVRRREGEGGGKGRLSTQEARQDKTRQKSKTGIQMLSVWSNWVGSMTMG
jgi:hypothetical protein